ncbi:MAG: hypothetical protein ACR2FY_21605 [Pirellulaceae bacterium]
MAALFPTFALYTTFASVTAAYCLLGYWLAFGKLNWLLRSAAVCSALVLLVPIRAYEPLVFFAITSLLFVGIAGFQELLTIWQEWRTKTESEGIPPVEKATKVSRQFQIRDLLGLTAVIGVGAWCVRTILAEEVWLSWVGLLFTAVVCVVATLLIARVLAGPKRLISAGIMLSFGVVAVAASRFFVTPGPTYPISILLEYLRGYVPGGPLPVTTLLVYFSFFLALAFWAQRWLRRVQVVSLATKIRKALAGAVVLTWSATTVWLYVQMFSFPVPPEPSRSGENSFPDVLSRCQGIAALSPRQADAASLEVAELVKKPCFVVVPWTAGLRERRNYEANLIAGLHDLRLVGRNLAAQASTSGLSSADLAANNGTDIICIGAMLGQDGLGAHSLVGLTIEQQGHWCLVPIRSKLSSSKALEVASELERIEEERETSEVALGRQDLWMHLNDRWEFGLYEILIGRPEDLSSRSDPLAVLYQVSRERTCCCSRLLITDLAIRAYRAEQGRYPDKLTDLAPKYLKQVPCDLYTDKLPVYRLTDSGFMLYSVGRGGKDNGGNFSSVRDFPRGSAFDWSLESLTR